MKSVMMLMMVASLLLACSAQAELIRYYNFNEGSGTIANDGAGTNEAGTFGAGKTQADWVAGKYGGGLEFNGLRQPNPADPTNPGADLRSANYDMVDAGLLDLANRGTVMAWIKQDSGPAVTYANQANWIIVNGDQSTGTFQFILYNQPSQGINLGGDLQGSGNGWPNLYTPNDTIPTDTWAHVAVSWDVSSNFSALYINGVQVATGICAAPLLATTGSLNIGGDPTYTGGGRGFDGTIDEVKVFDTFLDAAGVQAAMVPEPATMALLGLGALALRRRK